MVAFNCLFLVLLSALQHAYSFKIAGAAFSNMKRISSCHASVDSLETESVAEEVYL